jgi:hypothetical protein
MAESRAWLQMVQDNFPEISFHFTSEFKDWSGYSQPDYTDTKFNLLLEDKWWIFPYFKKC